MAPTPCTANDTEVLYSVDMTTNAIDTVFDGFPGNPGQMVYDADEDRLPILEHDVGIWGYDLQAYTYTMLLSLPYHFNHDITAACGDKWLLTMEFDQGGGTLYTVPKDLRAWRYTYWDWISGPEGVYYDPVGDSALYVLDDTVQTYTEPRAVASGISGSKRSDDARTGGDARPATGDLERERAGNGHAPSDASHGAPGQGTTHGRGTACQRDIAWASVTCPAEPTKAWNGTEGRAASGELRGGAVRQRTQGVEHLLTGL
ncbi:MAG: hypothetical protein R2810_04865 [Flavobacteriales bacterium]